MKPTTAPTEIPALAPVERPPLRWEETWGTEVDTGTVTTVAVVPAEVMVRVC